MTTTELSRVDIAINHAVETLRQSDAIIAEISDEYLQITVHDEDDQDGYTSAGEALKRIVRLRNDVDKKRKELKADALRYGKAVDAEAKRIQALIEPIESHLKSQKAIVDDATERKQREEHERRVSWLRGRIETANSIEWIVTADELEQMPDDVFELNVIKHRRLFETRQAERAELEAFREEKAAREAAEREKRMAPDRNRLEMIAEQVEEVSRGLFFNDKLLADQVAEILISTAEQIRRLV